MAFGSVDRRSIQLSYGPRRARVAAGGLPASLRSGMEIGLYTFAELSPDPQSGRIISPQQRVPPCGPASIPMSTFRRIAVERLLPAVPATRRFPV